MQRLKTKSVFQQPSWSNRLGRFFLFLIGGGVCCAALYACGTETKQSDAVAVRTSEQNAPLAVLMREMYVDMEEIKGAVVEKEKIGDYLARHRAMLIAEATDPKVRDSSFYAMANAYLLHLDKLEQSGEAELLSNFQVLQQSCVVCHQQKCPGPIKKINKLKVN